LKRRRALLQALMLRDQTLDLGVYALALPPSAGRTAGIAAASALRDDPLKAELAGLREDDRALSSEGFVEQNSLRRGDDAL
jgi:hypothetical protein